MSDRRAPVLLPVLAAAAIVVLLVALLPDGRAPWTPSGGPAVVDEFLAAYRRSRTEELVVVSDFSRTFNDGRVLAYEQRIVQRPPDDVLVVGAGSATGRLDGRIVRCNAAADGTTDCIRSDAAPPYAEVVDQEVEQLSSLLDAAYSVERQDPGCFVLRLELALPSPPYGGAARFCFDGASGAVRSLEIRRAEAVDRFDATDIRTQVTAADLRPDLGDPIASG